MGQRVIKYNRPRVVLQPDNTFGLTGKLPRPKILPYPAGPVQSIATAVPTFSKSTRPVLRAAPALPAMLKPGFPIKTSPLPRWRF